MCVLVLSKKRLSFNEEARHMLFHVRLGNIIPGFTLNISGEHAAMTPARQPTPDEVEAKIRERLTSYPALSKAQFGSFLIGSAKDIEAALKSLVSQGALKTRIVPTGKDMVRLYYLAEFAHLVEPFFDHLE